MSIGTRQSAETPYGEFVAMVKRKGMVRAELSHDQIAPHVIDSAAILDWQWDGELFSITHSGKRVVCSTSMPAFHVYQKAEVE